MKFNQLPASADRGMRRDCLWDGKSLAIDVCHPYVVVCLQHPRYAVVDWLEDGLVASYAPFLADRD